MRSRPDVIALVIGIGLFANVTLSLSKGAPACAAVAPTSAPTAAPATMSPLVTPTPGPFQLDRLRIGIVPRSTETAHAYGAHGHVKVTSSFAGVTAVYDVPSRTLLLKGVARGSGTVTLADASGATATAAVLVAPAAGTVASDVNVELAGDVTPLFVAAQLRDAIVQRSVLRPFVDVRIPFLSIPLHAAQSYTVPLDVGFDGKGSFVNVRAMSNVHLRLDPPVPPVPAGAPQTLFYSDSPEYVTADGVLFLSVTPVTPARPARVYLYHVAMTEQRTFSLVLRAHGAASHSPARPRLRRTNTSARATARQRTFCVNAAAARASSPPSHRVARSCCRCKATCTCAT